MVFQLGSALLDACVLSVLNKGDTYGYLLTQNVKGIIKVSESTLYPVLRRLQKDGLLSAYDDSLNGRNRRFYTITDQGRNMLAEYAREWLEYKAILDEMLLGGNNDEQE